MQITSNQLHFIIQGVPLKTIRYRKTNGIRGRFQRTIEEEFYAVTLRKKIYNALNELQADLDLWLDEYNNSVHTLEYTVTEELQCRYF